MKIPFGPIYYGLVNVCLASILATVEIHTKDEVMVKDTEIIVPFT